MRICDYWDNREVYLAVPQVLDFGEGYEELFQAHPAILDEMRIHIPHHLLRGYRRNIAPRPSIEQQHPHLIKIGVSPLHLKHPYIMCLSLPCLSSPLTAYTTYLLVPPRISGLTTWTLI
jgi:hypothetical protein